MFCEHNVQNAFLPKLLKKILFNLNKLMEYISLQHHKSQIITK